MPLEDEEAAHQIERALLGVEREPFTEPFKGRPMT